MATDDMSGPMSRGKRKHSRDHIVANIDAHTESNDNNDPSSQTDEPVAQAQWKPFHGRWQQQPKSIKSNNTHISQQKKKAKGKGKGKGNANANINAETSADPPAPQRSRRVMKAQRKAEQDAQKEARRIAQSLKQLGKQLGGLDTATENSTVPFGDVKSMGYTGGRDAVLSAAAPPFFPSSGNQGCQPLHGLQSLQGPRLPLQFPPQSASQPGLGFWGGNLQQTSAMSTASEAKPPSSPEDLEAEDAAASQNIEQADTADDGSHAQQQKQGSRLYAAPVPTAEYMAQAAKPPKDLNFMQPLLIILDLNGTLLYRTSKKMPPKFVKRPALNHFLERVTSRHMVMVWSSAQPATVESICREIFSPVQYQKLVGIWNRQHLDLPEDLYRNKVQVYKKLEKVWASKQIQKSYPDKKHRCGMKLHRVLRYHPTIHTENEMTGVIKKGWDQSNTVLIDDSCLKAAANPYNIFEIPEFTNKPNPDDNLVLKAVLERIKILAKSNDVSRRLHSWSKEGGEGITLDRDHILGVAEDEMAHGPTVHHGKKKALREITTSLTAADEKTDDKVRRLIRKKKKMEGRAGLKPNPPPIPLIAEEDKMTEWANDKIKKKKEKKPKGKEKQSEEEEDGDEDDEISSVSSVLNSPFALSSESESEYAAKLRRLKQRPSG